MVKENSEFASTQSSRESSPLPNSHTAKKRKEKKGEREFAVALIIILTAAIKPFGPIFSLIFLFIDQKLSAVASVAYFVTHTLPNLFN